MNVLIVEDELLIAMDLEMAVTALGHRVCGIVASARDAIAQAGAHQPDVTLMDIRLSGDSSGVDAAREIYACHRLRCIFLSANLDGTTRAALSAYEPIAFLGKPFLPIALQRAWKWRRGGLEAARRHNGKLRKVMEANTGRRAAFRAGCGCLPSARNG